MEGLSFKSTLSLLLVTLLFPLSASTAASPNSFILDSCKPTSYPNVCIESLAAFAPLVRRSPRTLAHAALTVSANRAHEASTYVTRLSSGMGHNSVRPQAADRALQDCVLTMSDSADRLQRAVRQLNHLGRTGRPSFALRLSNVLTWVSAALTDQSMCLLSLSQNKVVIGAASSKNIHLATMKRVAEVSRFTSNALVLVNRLGSRN